MDNNRIIIDKLEDIKIAKLHNDTTQLSNNSKISFGFDLNESVIDITQNGYAISYGSDILYTYGIDPCCGIVICNKDVRILFHVDGKITLEDVLSIINNINLTFDTEIVIILGASCGIKGSFDYIKIEKYFLEKGYKVVEKRIPATFGFIAFSSDRITIGTAVDRNLDIVLPVIQKDTQLYKNDLLDYTNFIKDINYNNGKSR